MVRLLGVVSLVVSVVAVTGCASVQVVQKTPQGGVVDLGGESAAAREKAEDLMRAECPFGYRIVDEQATKIAFACKDPSPASSSDPSNVRRESGVNI